MSMNSDEWQRLLASPTSNRIKFLENDCWLDLPPSVDLLKKLTRHLHFPKRDRPRSLLILAESGMGKSTIIREFISRHPPYREADTGILHQPVLRVEVSVPTDYCRMLQDILCAAGCPTRLRRAIDLNKYFARQMVKLGIRLIIIDEVQRIDLLLNRKIARQVCEALKWASSALKVPLVACGTFAARLYFAEDNQLARRFTVHEMPPWDLDSHFQEFVYSVLSFMPVRQGFDESIVKNHDALNAIHKASEATTGQAMDLIRDVTVAALDRHQEYLSVDDFVGLAQ